MVNTASRVPGQWGQPMNNKENILQMRDTSFFNPLITLTGYSVSAPEADTVDALVIQQYTLERGVLVERNFYSRKAFHKGFTFTIMMPPGLMYNALNKIGNARSTCYRTFYIVNLCVNADQKSFIALPQAIVAPPLQNNNLVATTEDGEALMYETTIQTARQLLHYAIKGVKRRTYTGGAPLHAIAFRFDDCEECELSEHQDGFFGGGTGTSAPILQSTTDRFSTSTAVTNLIPTNNIVTDLYVNGSILVATFANNTNPSSATSGGILYSTDGGVNTKVVSGLTDALFGVSFGNGYYYAVGKGGKIYRSINLTTWTLVSTTLNYNFTKIDFDQSLNAFFASALAGKAVKIEDVNVADITTEVNAGANNLWDVAVLADNHVIFVGDSGVARESTSASSSDTFISTDVNSTSATLKFVGGSDNRTIIGGGSTVWERSPLTDMRFKAITLAGGTSISGNVTAGVIGERVEGINVAAVVTDAGEILTFMPSTPDYI